MLRKHAVATVLDAWRVPRSNTERSLRKAAHRVNFEYTPRPGFLYVRSRAISSRTNDNHDTFPAEEIEKSYKTFLGKPAFVNHHNANHKRARGVIIAAALHRDKSPDGSMDTWVELLHEIDAVRFPKLAKAIIEGRVNRTSMGVDCEYSTCSACGNKATNPAEYCQHMPGKKGMKIRQRGADGKIREQRIHEICAGLTFFENSFLVEDPADPTAYVLDKPDTRGLARSASRVTAVNEEGGEQPVIPASRLPRMHMPPYSDRPRSEQLLDNLMNNPEQDWAKHEYKPQRGWEDEYQPGLHQQLREKRERNIRRELEEGDVNRPAEGWTHVHLRSDSTPEEVDRAAKNIMRALDAGDAEEKEIEHGLPERLHPGGVFTTHPTSDIEGFLRDRWHLSDFPRQEYGPLPQGTIRPSKTWVRRTWKAKVGPLACEHKDCPPWAHRGGTTAAIVRTAAPMTPHPGRLQGGACRENCTYGGTYCENCGVPVRINLHKTDTQSGGWHHEDGMRRDHLAMPANAARVIQSIPAQQAERDRARARVEDTLAEQGLPRRMPKDMPRDPFTASRRITADVDLPEATCPNCGSPRARAHDALGEMAQCSDCGTHFNQFTGREMEPGEVEVANAARANWEEYEQKRKAGEQLFSHFTPNYTHPLPGWDEGPELMRKRDLPERQNRGPGGLPYDMSTPTGRTIHRYRSERAVSQSQPYGAPLGPQRREHLSARHQAITGAEPPEGHDIWAEPHGTSPVAADLYHNMRTREPEDWYRGLEYHGPYHIIRHPQTRGTYVVDARGRDASPTGGSFGNHERDGSWGESQAESLWHGLESQGPDKDRIGTEEDPKFSEVMRERTPAFPHSRIDPQDIERARRPDARTLAPEGHSPEDEWHGPYEVVKHPETGRFHVVDNAGRHAPGMGSWRGHEDQLRAERSRDYIDRRQQSKDLAHGIADKIFNAGMEILDPGGTEESRQSDRNIEAGEQLMSRYAGGRGEIKFDPDEEGGQPYYHREHYLPNGKPSGWYAKHYGGPYVDIHHHATGDESHEAIHLPLDEHDHVPSDYDDISLGKDLKEWHDEEHGVRHYLESSDPRIQRWKRRHQGTRQAAAQESFFPAPSHCLNCGHFLEKPSGKAPMGHWPHSKLPFLCNDCAIGHVGSPSEAGKRPAIDVTDPGGMGTRKNVERIQRMMDKGLDPLRDWTPDDAPLASTSKLRAQASPRYDTPGDHPFFQANPGSKANLKAAWHDASPEEREQGRRWYPDAHLIAKAIGGGNAALGAGMISAYSPRTNWPANLFNAAHSIHIGRALGPGDGAIMGMHQRPAARILAGEHHSQVFKSPKVSAFAHLIEHGEQHGDRRVVVIDRHALSAWIGRRVTDADVEKAPIDKPRYYHHVEKDFLEAADELSEETGERITPEHLQAALWLRQVRKNAADDHAMIGAGAQSGRGRVHRDRKDRERWEEFRREHHPDVPGVEEMHHSAAFNPDEGYWTPEGAHRKHDEEASRRLVSVTRHMREAHDAPWATLPWGYDNSWQTPERMHHEWHRSAEKLGVDLGHAHSFEKVNPGATLQSLNSIRRQAADQPVRVPPAVDTLRPEACPVCGDQDVFKGQRCPVCGYVAPPDLFRDPDIDLAKQNRQDLEDGKLNSGFPEGPADEEQMQQAQQMQFGTGMSADEQLMHPDQIAPNGIPGAIPSANAPEQGMLSQGPDGELLDPSQLGPDGQLLDDDEPMLDENGQPLEGQEDEEGGETGDEDGDGIPGEPEDEVIEGQEKEEEGEELQEEGEEEQQDAAARSGGPPLTQGGDQGDQALAGGIDSMLSPGKDQDEGDAEEADEDDESGGKKKMPKDAARTVTAAQLAAVNELRHENQVLRAGLRFMAELAGAGPELDRILRQADVMNPAQPVPDPPQGPPTSTTEQALMTGAPTGSGSGTARGPGHSMDDPSRPGATPGSLTAVPAQQTTTSVTPGVEMQTPPAHQLIDVTAPVQGTNPSQDGGVPVEQRRIETDVRIDPDPLKASGPGIGGQGADGTAFPWVLENRPGGGTAVKAASREDERGARTMASIRLARLRVTAGIARGDELEVGAAIERDASLSLHDIEREITTLSAVAKTASAAPPRYPTGLAPRQQRVAARSGPSLASQPQALVPAVAAVSGYGDEDFDVFLD